MDSLQHIAFIMDGNSSWAKHNGKPAMEGYLRGLKTLSNMIIDCNDLGIKYMTCYAFSSENWKRPSDWVLEFMNLIKWFFKNDESIKRALGVSPKINFIGNTSKLDKEFQSIIKEYEEKTKNNTGIVVNLAVSYGGRDEIVRTVKKMLDQGIEITEENISNNLDTAGCPDPDLLIRTSNKYRLSNFLPWQLSYTEFYFSTLFWPEFDKEELNKAIAEFSKRNRTFGQ